MYKVFDNKLGVRIKKITNPIKFLIFLAISLRNEEYKLEDDYYSDWDGTVSFNGIKRVIYSFYHFGCNEMGDNIIQHSPFEIQSLFTEYSSFAQKNIPEPKFLFPS